MKNYQRRIIALILSILIVVSTGITAFASEKVAVNKKENLKASKDCPTYSFEDVIALDPYVRVEKGLYVLDKKAALAAGIDSKLINSQAEFIKTINQEAKDGKIAINGDKDFDVLCSNSIFSSATTTTTTIDTDCSELNHWRSCGGGKTTRASYHWWGISRSFCNCSTQKLAADLNSCGAVYAAIGVICAYFTCGTGALVGGLSSAYFWLFASRLTANDHGRGVSVNLTWVLAFSIKPQ